MTVGHALGDQMAVLDEERFVGRARNDGGRRDTIGDALFDRLADDALHGVDPLVLEVAALARAVDAQMLAAVLPGHAGAPHEPIVPLPPPQEGPRAQRGRALLRRRSHPRSTVIDRGQGRISR